MKTKIPEILGCAEDKIDIKDKIYEDFIAGKAKPVGMPSLEQGFSNQEKYGKLIEDNQYRAFCCVGEGSSNDVEMSILVATGKQIHLSALDIYSQIYLRQGGASPRDAYKLLNKVGVCEAKYLVRPTGLSEPRARQRGQVTQERLDNALKYKIGKYYSIRSYDPNVFAQAIFTNNGVGGGYRPVSGAMGHFIFFEGYGMREWRGKKLLALKYFDSYPPFEKWLVFYKNKTYLDNPDGLQVQLFSHWTAEHNKDWYKMAKIYRKKNCKEVMAVIGQDPYWFETLRDFNNHATEIPWLRWDNVEVVDEFPFDFKKDGRTIGKSNFREAFIKLLGKAPEMDKVVDK